MRAQRWRKKAYGGNTFTYFLMYRSVSGLGERRHAGSLIAPIIGRRLLKWGVRTMDTDMATMESTFIQSSFTEIR